MANVFRLIPIVFAAAVFLPTVLFSVEKYGVAIFAGGCFWCMQPPFENIPGVTQVVAGYAGGTGSNPNYGDYAEKDYVEAVRITYDPSKISYAKLLDIFWRQIDPTDPDGQFVDRGPQYRPVIFYETEEQRAAAMESKAALEKSRRFDRPIRVEIVKATTFFKAEDYHQDYYKKSPLKYEFYRFNSGRDEFIKKMWGDRMETEKKGDAGSGFAKPGKDELKKKLTPEQYKVTQENGTEPAFNNAYWDNEKEGIYVDIVSGEPLFSSTDKFDSGTGWPSFTKPLEMTNVVERTDNTLFVRRTEVRSRHADSHLGHVFNDGPPPTHLRYCMNSAALRFVPKEDLAKEGLGRYLKLFGQNPRKK